MLPNQEERIRVRAYEIWEREGRPDGREAEHWNRARQEIEAEGESRDQAAPSAPALGTAPTAAEIAARDPSGRGGLSEAQEGAAQSTFVTEADPLGNVQGESDIPDESAMAPNQTASGPKRRSTKARSPRRRKVPVEPQEPDRRA